MHAKIWKSTSTDDSSSYKSWAIVERVDDDNLNVNMKYKMVPFVPEHMKYDMNYEMNYDMKY